MTKRGAAETLVESWDGTRWSLVSSPPAAPSSRYNYLHGVSCIAANACVAVGDYGTDKTRTLVESWDGKKWSIVPSANEGVSSLSAVSCTSATNCTAVGQSQSNGGATKTLVEDWNGKVWAVVSSPDEEGPVRTNVLDGVSCASANVCVAVGHYVTQGYVTKALVAFCDVLETLAVPQRFQAITQRRKERP